MNPRPRAYYGSPPTNRLIEAVAVVGLTVFFVGCVAVMIAGIYLAAALMGALR